MSNPPSNCVESIAGPADAGERLDRFLGGLCPDFSRSRLQGFIRDGLASVNAQPAKSSLVLREGDSVILEIPEETLPSPLAAQEMPLACVLEGGTWAAGRELAQARRGGEPPFRVISDGTVF